MKHLHIVVALVMLAAPEKVIQWESRAELATTLYVDGIGPGELVYTRCRIKGDLNGDGIAELDDIMIVLSAYANLPECEEDTINESGSAMLLRQDGDAWVIVVPNADGVYALTDGDVVRFVPKE